MASPTPSAAPVEGKRDCANYADGFANRFRTLPGWRPMAVGVAAAIVAATASGAFGTARMALGPRLVFWIATLGVVALLWRGWFALVVRRSDQWNRAVLMGIVPVTLPLPLVLQATLRLVGGQLRSDWWHVWPSGLAIAGAAAAALLLAARDRVMPLSAPPPAKGRLFRHGVTDPTRLVRASAEDHYVRLLLDDGRSLLVHDRFSALEPELAALDGAVARRGEWVAARAVERIERDGRRTLVRLRGGDAIAVSPAGRDALRARGWLS